MAIHTHGRNESSARASAMALFSTFLSFGVADKSKETTTGEAIGSFSSSFGCWYCQILYKSQSRINAGLVLTSGLQSQERK